MVQAASNTDHYTLPSTHTDYTQTDYTTEELITDHTHHYRTESTPTDGCSLIVQAASNTDHRTEGTP